MRRRLIPACLTSLAAFLAAACLAGGPAAAEDRYGPPAPQDAAAAAQAPTPQPERYLSWPDKAVAPALLAQAPLAQAPLSQAPGAPIPSPAPAAWSAPAAPTSLYAAPPPLRAAP